MTTTTRLPPKELKFGKNMRTGELDESLLRELGESMRVKQQQRIIIAPDKTVIVGNRRTKAALLVGLESVEVEILDEMPDESTILMYQWAENYFREGVSDWDKLQTCYCLIQLKITWNHVDVARFLRVNPSMVSRYLSVARKAISAVRDAMRDGLIGIGSAYSISKEPEDKQPAMLELALNGTSRDELERHRRKPRRRWNRSSAKMRKITLPLASGITVTFSGDKISIDDLIEAAGEVQREAKHRRDKDHFDAEAFEILMRQKSKGESRPETANA